jgi:hypothetical protein
MLPPSCCLEMLMSNLAQILQEPVVGATEEFFAHHLAAHSSDVLESLQMCGSS